MKQTVDLDFDTLVARLQHINLSHLARDSGVSLRTLRRLRNGAQCDVRVSTLEKLRPFLSPKKSRKKM